MQWETSDFQLDCSWHIIKPSFEPVAHGAGECDALRHFRSTIVQPADDLLDDFAELSQLGLLETHFDKVSIIASGESFLDGIVGEFGAKDGVLGIRIPLVVILGVVDDWTWRDVLERVERGIPAQSKRDDLVSSELLRLTLSQL